MPAHRHREHLHLNHRFGEHRASVVKKYAGLRNNPNIVALPGRFVDCCAFLFRICVPRNDVVPNAQRAFYNRKYGGHSITFCLVTFPDGLSFITGGDAGSKNDPAVIADNDVNGILHAARHANGDEVVCLADAAFGLSNNIRPLLKRNMIAYAYYPRVMRRALSACRIAVEWSVGEVKMDEQFLHNKHAMRISALLRNVFRRMSACNASTYLDDAARVLEDVKIRRLHLNCDGPCSFPYACALALVCATRRPVESEGAGRRPPAPRRPSTFGGQFRQSCRLSRRV